MRKKIIDLRDKKMAQAKKAMKRLIAWRKEKNAKINFTFLLPSYQAIKRSFFWPDKTSSRCPNCFSPLVETDVGVVCSGKFVPDIIWDIRKTIDKWGNKAELFLTSKRSNRFFDEFLYSGNDMTCSYVQGNEEHRFRIRNRLLRPGVDRRKIKQ